MIIFAILLTFIIFNDMLYAKVVALMFRLRLKQLREEIGISQAALATQLGVAQSTVGMWENGKNKPAHAKLEQLANFFGVSTDYLIGRSDDDGRAGEKQTPALTNENGPDDELFTLLASLPPRKKKLAKAYLLFLTDEDDKDNS